MIVGLPEIFPIDELGKFSIGEAEGKTDNLLEECLCEIAPIKEFLLGKKDIILGEKGAGKTALFRMLSEGKLNFVTPPNKTYKILALDESIEYKQLKSIIDTRIQATSAGDNDSIKYQFIWELYITFKMLGYVIDELNLDNNELKIYKKDISEALGFEKETVGMVQFFLNHKKTVGIKLDTLHPTSSNFYLSAEPVDKARIEENVFNVDLKAIKRKISSLLDKNNMALYVLLDRLDEFVIKEDYKVQKNLLEGLMACYRNFSSTTQIRIMPFLRTDIFNRLDLSGLGTDKILSKIVHLKWQSSDLRDLMARRLAHNYCNVFDVPYLEVEVDEERFHLDPKFVEEESIRSRNDERNFVRKWCSRKWRKFITKVIIRINELNRRERKINFNDVIARDAIHLIFPKTCEHISESGKRVPIRFIDFLDTHLIFSSGYSTPRLMIAFFEECLYQTRTYFSNNANITEISKNYDDEYALVKIECITRAYSQIRQNLWTSIARDANDWENKVQNLMDSLAKKQTLSFEDIYSHTDWEHDKEPMQFIAFVTQAGILKCKTPSKPHNKREYEFPILFRDVHIVS